MSADDTDLRLLRRDADRQAPVIAGGLDAAHARWGGIRWIVGLLVMVTPVTTLAAPPATAEPSAATPTPDRSSTSSTPPLPATDNASRLATPERWITRLRPGRNVVELGVGVGALLPSAAHELYQYDTTWRRYAPAATSLAVRAGFYPLALLGVEAEAGLAPTHTDAGAAARIFGARGHLVAQLPLYSVVPFVLVGGGLLGTGGALGRDIDPSLHFGGGLKVFATRWIGGRIDARTHLGLAHTVEASRTFHTEVLASLVVTLHRPYLDTDHDGVPDPGQRARSEDACPREHGVRSLRGCPDDDRDGIRNLDDRCPKQSGLAVRDGCPPLVDEDGDGFYDAGQYNIPEDRKDTCPDIVGVAEYNGCPAPDSDGDGLLDLIDRCPKDPETVNGFEDENGCPDVIPPDIAAILGTLRGITFGFLSDRLSESSKPILARAAEVLRRHPHIKIEIQGHTDADGDPAVNKALSLRRAMSVRRELVDQGIVECRLRAAGYGGEQPLDGSDGNTARAANRRIEFRLVGLNEDLIELDTNPGPSP